MLNTRPRTQEPNSSCTAPSSERVMPITTGLTYTVCIHSSVQFVIQDRNYIQLQGELTTNLIGLFKRMWCALSWNAVEYIHANECTPSFTLRTASPYSVERPDRMKQLVRSHNMSPVCKHTHIYVHTFK